MTRRLRAVPDPDASDDGWVVTVYAAGPTPAADLEQLAAALAVAMEEYGGTVQSAGDRLRYGVALSIRHGGLDAAAAGTLGCNLFEELSAKVGMPRWPIVFVEAMTFAEHDRQPDVG